MSMITHFNRIKVQNGFCRRTRHVYLPRSGNRENAYNCWIIALCVSNPLIRENDAPNSPPLISNNSSQIPNNPLNFSNNSISGSRPILSCFFFDFKERGEGERREMNPTVFRVYEKSAQQSAMWKTRNCWRLLESNLLKFKTNTGKKPIIQQSNSCAAPPVASFASWRLGDVRPRNEANMMDFSLILTWDEEETKNEFSLVGNHYLGHGNLLVLTRTES